MAAARPNIADSGVRHGAKGERVYLVLRRRIRELELPPGAPLRKDEIALELGVSRGPVSEALTRLAEERLVDVFPQHGSFVAPIRAADVRDGLFIRIALECEAARRVAGRSEAGPLLAELDENLAAQAAALEAADLEGFYDLDEAMHAAIFAAAGAPGALRLLNAARAPLEALRTGDPEYAAAAMRAHLVAAARMIERRLSPGETR